MKLNHLNLAVNNIAESQLFLEIYFGFRATFEGNDNIVVLFGDDDFVLTLMPCRGEAEVGYPSSFHIGFIQESKEKVNELNQRLKDDGFDVKPPRHFHNSWTFYFRAPGGFTVEVLC